MHKFTAKEILQTAEMFRKVPQDFRGIVTGMMMGANIVQDKDTVSEMVKLAMSMRSRSA